MYTLEFFLWFETDLDFQKSGCRIKGRLLFNHTKCFFVQVVNEMINYTMPEIIQTSKILDGMYVIFVTDYF